MRKALRKPMRNTLRAKDPSRRMLRETIGLMLFRIVNNSNRNILSLIGLQYTYTYIRNYNHLYKDVQMYIYIHKKKIYTYTYIYVYIYIYMISASELEQ